VVTKKPYQDQLVVLEDGWITVNGICFQWIIIYLEGV